MVRSTCHLGLDQIVLERAQRAVIPGAASAATFDYTVRRLRRVRGCYTVVSAAGSQFCCKNCRCGLVYEAARQRCHNGQKNRNATVSLLGLCLSQHQHKHKSLPWRGLSAVGPVLLGREELCTRSMQSTQQGNTHRHRRAWGRGLENLALPLRARPSRK